MNRMEYVNQKQQRNQGVIRRTDKSIYKTQMNRMEDVNKKTVEKSGNNSQGCHINI